MLLSTTMDYAFEAKNFVTNVMKLFKTIKYSDISDEAINNFADSAVTPFMDKHTAYLLSRIVLMESCVYSGEQKFIKLCSDLTLPEEFVVELFKAVSAYNLEELRKVIDIWHKMGDPLTCEIDDDLELIDSSTPQKDHCCVIM